jgi:spore maturation protein CgeB
LARGHDVDVYEPADAWSVRNLVAERGPSGVEEYRSVYPRLSSVRYGDDFDLDRALDAADLVIVHEWNEHDLVARIGQHRAAVGGYVLLFHDTHHRSVTDQESMAAYDLSHYDGVLAFGRVIREVYLERGWTQRAWTWHEAADQRVFYPRQSTQQCGDLVWIGNWGDNERSAELKEFLIEPVEALGLRARVYGVRYPEDALRVLDDAGIEYGGWVPNYEAPEIFASYDVTVHVPRRPYAEALPGIPTIRVFEAMACGIPLISAPWEDVEGLFSPGKDFLFARDGAEMRRLLRDVLNDHELGSSLTQHALQTISDRHTCAHRVDELLEIVNTLRVGAPEIRERAVAV